MNSPTPAAIETATYKPKSRLPFMDGPLGHVLRSADLRRLVPVLALSALLSNLLSLGLPLAILQILDRVVSNQSLETLAFLVTGIVLALILEEVLRAMSTVITGWLGIRYEHKAAISALDKLLRTPMRRYQKEEPGAYAERILATAKVAEFYSGQALLVVFDLPFVIVFLFVIAAIGGWLAVVPAALLALFVFLSMRFGQHLNDQIERRQMLDDRRFSFLAEVLSNIHSVKTLTMEFLMLRRYERLQESNAGIGETLTYNSARASDLGILFSQIMIVSVIFAGSVAVIMGNMTPGGLAATMMLSVRALQPLRRSLSVWLRYQAFISAEQRLNDIMHMPVEGSEDKPVLPPVKQGLELRDVSLRHGDAPALFSRLSLSVTAGECIAIQGESGSGKTSLLSLLNALEAPDQGAILMDGQPIQNFALDSIHKEIAFLPQSGQILSGTILENMTMFDSSLNEAALAIAREMGLDHVVAGMKTGYQTPLGEGVGETLPEGVRQMIAIVRALVHDPSVILFDETNIHLDMDGDRRLRDYLSARKGQKTMVLVTRRPSMLSLADKVYSLIGGGLKEGHLRDLTGAPDLQEKAADEGRAADRPAAITDLGELVDKHFEVPSDLSRCLMPLLKALDWQGQPRHLAEAMPHLPRELDLSGFCSLLSNLELLPRHFHSSLATLDERLVPCLFIAPNSPAMVILACEPDGRVRVFNGGNGNVETLEGNALGLEGDAFLFKKHEPEDKKAKVNESWFWSLIWRLRKHLALILGLTVLSTALALTPPLFVRSIFDTVVPSGDLTLGAALTLGVLLTIGLDWMLRGLKNRILAYVGGRTEYVLGTSVFERILCLPATSTDGASINRQVGRIKNLESLRDFFLGPLVLIVFELPASLVMMTALAVINPWIMLVILAAVGAYTALWIASRTLIQNTIARASSLSATRSEFVNEALSGMRTIRNSGAGAILLQRFTDISGKAVLSSFHDHQIRTRVSGVAQVLGMCTGLFSLAVSAYLAIIGQLSGGAMIATMMIVWRLTGPIQNVFLAATSLVRTRTNIRQVENLMRLQIERDSGVNQIVRPELNGALNFSRVSFRYANDADPALLGINVTIDAGQLVVIAGANGAGKSTLLKLITRVYMPQAGTIRLDGVDIRQISPSDLRGRISYMPQNCEIFYGTIAQNLRLVHPAATDEEIRWAVDMAGLTADIAALPQGLETRISNSRSEQLPYGFRQRLMLARTMLKPAPVVLLDEPGTGMDQAGEVALIRCIEWLRGRSTLLIVTHRPGHMRIADKVIYMENGAVTAMGPFESIKNRVMAGLN
ncbi:peptidase domain-containing ABC transporter [Noviherbaspirillum sp. ST9]|uniref:peptidase domain-containing ABC transporter n=1 Tax=Noviherbaspirillum sp. ST9 TaxID=3401606 RepID=UPI003B58A96E